MRAHADLSSNQVTDCQTAEQPHDLEGSKLHERWRAQLLLKSLRIVALPLFGVLASDSVLTLDISLNVCLDSLPLFIASPSLGR